RQAAWRRLAAVREPAVVADVPVDVSRQEAPVHGWGVRSAARMEPSRVATMAFGRRASERGRAGARARPEPRLPRHARAAPARSRRRRLRVVELAGRPEFRAELSAARRRRARGGAAELHAHAAAWLQAPYHVRRAARCADDATRRVRQVSHLREAPRLVE